MPILLGLQKLPWKGDWGWKKSVFASFFGWPEDREFVEKKGVLGHPIARATSYCLFPDTLLLRASKNAFKVGSVKFANSLSPPSIARKYAQEVKAAKGLKRCRAKVKGVNNPAWIAQKHGVLAMCPGPGNSGPWSPSQMSLLLHHCFQWWQEMRLS